MKALFAQVQNPLQYKLTTITIKEESMTEVETTYNIDKKD